jgi:L-threonylcarbamoyladenylate synthase
VLIDSVKQLFDVYEQEMVERLHELWPGRNSIILPSENAPDWLMRGNASVAYRIPDDPALRRLIAQTGPLIAPSANPEGMPPALTIKEARAYFGETVDFYVNGGEVADDTPSRLYRLLPAGLERLR